MRVIITGVCGFIGSNICKNLLELGYKVIGIDNLICGYEENIATIKLHKNFVFYKLSIEDADVYRILEKNDIVLNLAAISSLPGNQQNPAFSYHNNVVGMCNLLEASRIIGIKHFIFASTGAIYENNNNFPSNEDDIVCPSLIYSLGKKHCEDILFSYHSNYNLQFSILRFFNVYGPNQDHIRNNPPLVPYLIKCSKNNEIPLLHSDGNQERDYVFIDDIVKLINILIEKDPINDVINVCSGKTVSVKNILKIIKSYFPNNNIEPIYRDPILLWEKVDVLWKGNFTFSNDRLKHEVNKYSLGDPGKAKKILDWEAKTDIFKGIEICINYFIKNS